MVSSLIRSPLIVVKGVAHLLFYLQAFINTSLCKLATFLIMLIVYLVLIAMHVTTVKKTCNATSIF